MPLFGSIFRTGVPYSSSSPPSKSRESEPEASAACVPGPLFSQLQQDIEGTPPLSQPSTPKDFSFPAAADNGKMPTTSIPINIATPSRNSSSSPASQAQMNAQYLEPDSRTSAMLSNNGFDTSMGMGGGGRQESYTGAKPISMNNPHRNNPDERQRRESLANSFVNGMSWGGVSVGSWIRDE